MVGTVEGVRRANLGRVLEAVHRQGALSRATLTEQTGLNRSTVGDLVGELAALGLVAERAPDPSRRVGRPSPVVETGPDVVALAVHPEVDALEIGAIRLDQTVAERVRIPQHELPTPEAAVAAVAARIRSWRRDALRGVRIVGIGVAVPGLVRAADGVVRRAPHLGWSDVPLQQLLSADTDTPVVVGNDASLAAVAEHLFGAGRGIDDMVYLNGGASGIGGGLIVDGRAVGGASGYAGEFGQNRPNIADAADRVTAHGVLEDEVNRARLLDAVDAHDIDDTELAGRLERTASAQDELTRQRRILATALANAVNVLNPAQVILGGFLPLVAGDVDAFTAAVRAQSMGASAADVRITSAELAGERILIGAAEAAFAALLADPATVCS